MQEKKPTKMVEGKKKAPLPSGTDKRVAVVVIVVAVSTLRQTVFGKEVMFYSCESVCFTVFLFEIEITQKVFDRFR